MNHSKCPFYKKMTVMIPKYKGKKHQECFCLKKIRISSKYATYKPYHFSGEKLHTRSLSFDPRV